MASRDKKITLVVMLVYLVTLFSMVSTQCPNVRVQQPVYQGKSFLTNFQNRSQALTFFTEGLGPTTTSGSLACRNPDHLIWNTSFASSDLHGVTIRLDDRNATSCNPNSKVATGHLLTEQYLPYGQFELSLRTAHGLSVSQNLAAPPDNVFTCFGLYVHNTKAASGFRNEISMCVSSMNTRTIRLGYWVGDDGDKQHGKQVKVPLDLSQSFNNLTINWSPTSIQFKCNSMVLWHISEATAVCAGKEETKGGEMITRIPWEPMSVRLILRPLTKDYYGPAQVDIAHFSYHQDTLSLPPAAADSASKNIIQNKDVTVSSASDIRYSSVSFVWKVIFISISLGLLYV